MFLAFLASYINRKVSWSLGQERHLQPALAHTYPFSEAPIHTAGATPGTACSGGCARRPPRGDVHAGGAVCRASRRQPQPGAATPLHPAPPRHYLREGGSTHRSSSSSRTSTAGRAGSHRHRLTVLHLLRMKPRLDLAVSTSGCLQR
jgi:hypothetical protein